MSNIWGKYPMILKKKSFKIVKQRIAQGGLRLASIIGEIFNSYIKAKLSPASRTMILTKHKNRRLK